MSTTLGSAHGLERECANANCKMTYRYPPAATFVCQACGVQQPWNGWPGANTTRAVSKKQQDPRIEQKLEQRVTESGTGFTIAATTELPSIDLRAVHATLNQISADGLRQLADRLVILNLVDQANLTRTDPGGEEHFARVRQALAGAGMKF